MWFEKLKDLLVETLMAVCRTANRGASFMFLAADWLFFQEKR